MNILFALLLLLTATFAHGNGRINSIQRSSGNLTWSSESPGEKTANVTISSVDTSVAFVTTNGWSSTDSTPSNCFASAQLTSATNVQIRGHCHNNTSASFSASITVYFTVVEAP